MVPLRRRPPPPLRLIPSPARRNWENWSPVGRGERLVAIWNSPPGVTPVKKLKDRTTAATRIWKNIQELGEVREPRPFPYPDTICC